MKVSNRYSQTFVSYTYKKMNHAKKENQQIRTKFNQGKKWFNRCSSGKH